MILLLQLLGLTSTLFWPANEAAPKWLSLRNGRNNIVFWSENFSDRFGYGLGEEGRDCVAYLVVLG